jgi:hypothetical protein
MTAALQRVLFDRCNYCSRELPRFRLHQVTQAQTVCDDCLDWHFHALEVLAGAPPAGCQGCYLSWQELSDRTPGVQVRMYVMPRDGIMQLLCTKCAREYLPARKDLFKGTQFGTEVLKI